MTYDADFLYRLLPAIHRLRDETGDGSLKGLLAVLGEQLEVLEEANRQAYDDLFIETCADWVAPYIGDLVGARLPHAVTEKTGSARALVANTITYRRRKGTLAALEQLARDATGWPALAVEYFQRLAWTQYLNHLRPAVCSVDLRDAEAALWRDTPLDRTARSLEVRRIEPRRGRHNIANVGLHLWRLKAQSLTRLALRPMRFGALATRRYTIHPYRLPLQLFARAEPEADIAGLADFRHLPLPLTRPLLSAKFAHYYGEGRSLALYLNGALVPAERIVVCDLADQGNTWRRPPPGRIGLDPVRGRVFLDITGTHQTVEFSGHYGQPGDLAGGEYPRDRSFTPGLAVARAVQPGDDLQAALATRTGVVEFDRTARYLAPLQLEPRPAGQLELRARDGSVAFLDLDDALTPRGGPADTLILNGLVMRGRIDLRAARNRLGKLVLRHCTLLPEGGPSLDVGIPMEVEIESCVLGPIRCHEAARLTLRDSILDAGAADHTVLGGLEPDRRAGLVTLDEVTAVGQVLARRIDASNCLFIAAPTPAWAALDIERQQEGCVRFSWVPEGSRTPRRHQCVSDAPGPAFAATRYGHPAYLQLARTADPRLARGADDESEMGVWHDLYAPQREANLRLLLAEYLRAGLEAGIFMET
jgi:hypothetical protein